MNTSFEEYEKDNITLSIEATENDVNKFGKMLRLKNEYGLRSFKKKSDIGKDFAQRCIDEKVIINLWNPRILDYFENIGLRGCSYYRFIHQDLMYMKIDSDYFDEKEVPEGFKVIKLSEFYIKLEEHKNQQKEVEAQ